MRTVELNESEMLLINGGGLRDRSRSRGYSGGISTHSHGGHSHSHSGGGHGRDCSWSNRDFTRGVVRGGIEGRKEVLLVESVDSMEEVV